MIIKCELIIKNTCYNNQSNSTFYLRDITDTSERYSPNLANLDYNSPEYFVYSTEPVYKEGGYSFGIDARIFQVQLPSREYTKKFLNLYVSYLSSHRPGLPFYPSKQASIATDISTILQFIDLAQNNHKAKHYLFSSFESYYGLLKIIQLFQQDEIIPPLLRYPELWLSMFNLNCFFELAEKYPDYANQITRAALIHHPDIKKLHHFKTEDDLKEITFEEGKKIIMKGLLADPGKCFPNNLIDSFGLKMLINFHPQFSEKIKHHLLSNQKNFEEYYQDDNSSTGWFLYKDLFPKDPIFALPSKEIIKKELIQSYGNIQRTLGFFREAKYGSENAHCLLNTLSPELSAKIAAFTNSSQNYSDDQAEQIAMNCLIFSKK